MQWWVWSQSGGIIISKFKVDQEHIRKQWVEQYPLEFTMGCLLLPDIDSVWLRLAHRHKKVLENTNPSHSLPTLERELFRAQMDKVKHVLLYKLRILLHSAQFFLNSIQLWLFTGHFMSFCHLFCQRLFFFNFPSLLLMLQCWQY